MTPKHKRYDIMLPSLRSQILTIGVWLYVHNGCQRAAIGRPPADTAPTALLLKGM